MRAVIQRVKGARVRVGDRVVGRIGRGLLVLLGVGEEDSEFEAQHLADKTVKLRIFEDSEGKMNLSVLDFKGEILVVSQFTLYADTRKGNRPSFTAAAKPEKAEVLYEFFIAACERREIQVARGEFGARMDVEIVNDGPVTILLDSGKIL